MLLAEIDQLRQSVTNWAAAVAERDNSVKEANARILSLSSDLNRAIEKFNELATNYRHVVEEVNRQRTNGSSAPSP